MQEKFIRVLICTQKVPALKRCDMRVKVLILFYSVALTLQPAPFAFSTVSYKT